MIGPLTDAVIEAATVDAVRRSLAEDVDERGDVTAALVPESARGHLAITAREAGVVAGSRCAITAFAHVDPTLVVTWHCPDGTTIGPGDLVAEVHGSFRSILTAERTALNFLGHLSGIASLTAQFAPRSSTPPWRSKWSATWWTKPSRPLPPGPKPSSSTT